MFEIKKYRDELKSLENELAKPDTVHDGKKMTKLNREYNRVKELVDTIALYETIDKSLKESLQILESNDDKELVAMAQAEVEDLKARKERLQQEIENLINPPDQDDDRNVIVEIRAGTGGDEAALFAGDLLSMYTKFAEGKSWKAKLLSQNKTELKGIKEAVISIAGRGVYQSLKYESGVHRVQRIPETEKSGRIHTSTATVAVLPEVDDIEINIDPKDLRTDTYLASGKGGQNVQKNETAVRITHVPSGIVGQSQSERSQQQNRISAMNMLKAKLYAKEKQEKEEKRASERKGQVGAAERAEKIRTYNYPQDRVTDHRVQKSWHNLPGILAGELEPLIKELSKPRKKE